MAVLKPCDDIVAHKLRDHFFLLCLSTAARLKLFLLFVNGNRVLRVQRELSKGTEVTSFPGSHLPAPGETLGMR